MISQSHLISRDNCKAMANDWLGMFASTSILQVFYLSTCLGHAVGSVLLATAGDAGEGLVQENDVILGEKNEYSFPVDGAVCEGTGSHVLFLRLVSIRAPKGCSSWGVPEG